MCTFSIRYCLCHVCTDVSKSNMQENLRYKDSRLLKGLHLICVAMHGMYTYSCVSYHVDIILL